MATDPLEGRIGAIEDPLAGRIGSPEPSVDPLAGRVGDVAAPDPFQQRIDDEVYAAELRKAKTLSDVTGEPQAKFRAQAHARRAMKLSDEMAADPTVQAAAEGERVTQAPGKQIPMTALVDVMDFLTSPVSRPVGAMTSARADLNTLRGKTPEERLSWVSKLHKEDARTSALAELAEALNRQEEEGGGLVDKALGHVARSYERMGAGPFSALLGDSLPSVSPQHAVARAVDRLAMVYEMPNMADPYGGTGVPRPWQELDDKGRVAEGSPPADVVDVVLRGLASGPAAAEERVGARASLQHMGVDIQSLLIGGLKRGEDFDATEALLGKGDWAARQKAALAYPMLAPLLTAPGVLESAKAYRESAHESVLEGDRRTGLFFPEVAYTAAPDLGVKKTPLGFLLGARTEAVSTAAGLMTKDGADALNTQRKAAIHLVLEDAEEVAKSRGAELTTEEIGVLTRDATAAVTNLFNYAGRKARETGDIVEKIDVSDAVRIGEDGKVVAHHDKIVVSTAKEGDSVFVRRGKAAEAIDRTIRWAITNDDGNARFLSLPGGHVIPIGSMAGGVAERARGALQPIARQFEPFATYDEAKKVWRPVRVSDLLENKGAKTVGEQAWRAAMAASGKKRRTFNALAHAVDAAVYNIRRGSLTDEQDAFLLRFAEELDDPSRYADGASALVGSLEKLIAKSLRIIPAHRIAEETRLSRDALQVASARLSEASNRHQAAMRQYEAALRADADTQSADELKALLAEADKELREIKAAVAAVGGDEKAAAEAAVEAARVRKEAMFRVQRAVSRVKKARGTVDEAAARLEKKKAAAAAARAQADAHQAARAAKEAEGKKVPKSLLDKLKAKQDEFDRLSREIGKGEVDLEKLRSALRAAEAEVAGHNFARKQASERFTQAADRMKSLAAASARKQTRLLDPVAEALETAADAAQASRRLLRTMTGFGSAAEQQAAKRVADQIDVAIARSKAFAEDVEFNQAIASLTYAQTRQAERAFNRAHAKINKQAGRKMPREAAHQALEREWADLPDKLKTAVRGVRSFFDEMYETLKAEGRLPKGWSREVFLERMRVEGYVRHALSRGGQRAMERIRRQHNLSTDLDFTLARKKKGTVGEINQRAREDIARMIWDHKNPAAAGKASEFDIAWTIREEGLDAIEYFETDVVSMMRTYGRDVARSTSNARFIQTMRELFPEGDEFAAMSKDPARYTQSGLEHPDVLAEAAGYRRVNGASHAYAVLDVAAWDGWRTYKNEIDNILKQGPPGDQIRALNDLMDRAGVPKDAIVRSEIEVVTKALYLPTQIADFVEGLADPKWREGFTAAVGKVVDPLTNFFKSSVTIGAIAFHGRNAISNTIQSLMVFGPKAINPINQMDAIAILNGKEDAIYRLDVGGVIESKTIGEWRRELHMEGILTDRATFADLDKTFEGFRVNLARGAVATAGGSLAGGAVGAGMGEDTGEKVRYGLAGMILGGMGASMASGGFDVYLKRGLEAKLGGTPLQAAGDAFWKTLGLEPTREAALRRAARATWAEAFTKVVEDAFPVVSEAVKAGTVAGAAVAGAAVVTPGLNVGAGVAAGAAVFATKVTGEGLFQIGGGIGQAIEQQARLANYLAARKAGHTSFEAAELVNKTLFDYDDLSNFERYVARRAFPFWTWTSRNLLELQPFLATHRPEASTILNKILMAAARTNPTDEDLSLLDDHLKYRVIANFGQGKVIAGFGLPVESVAELLKPGGQGVVSMAHPIVPFIRRFGTGVDPYYGVPMKEIRTARDVLYMPGPIQRWVGLEEKVLKNPKAYVAGDDARVVPEIGWYQNKDGTWRQDPERGSARLALLRSFPAWRLVGEYNKAMAETFMRGVGSGSGPEATASERIAALITGIKPYGLDWDALERKALYRLQSDLEERLKDAGKLGETTYVRKHLEGPTRLEEYEAAFGPVDYGAGPPTRQLIDPNSDTPVQ